MKALTKIAIAALALTAGIASAQTTAGTGATAQSGVVIGQGAAQVDINGPVGGVTVNYRGGIAIGNGATAQGKNIALGDGISAIQDDVTGSYSLVIGGINSNNGLIEFRRVIGMANGLFANDGANLGQVWEARDFAIMRANGYTDQAVAGINGTLASHNVRINNAQATGSFALSRANTAITLIGGINSTLVDHDTRITAAQGTADAALDSATGAHVRLDGHDTRITAAQATADAGLSSAVIAHERIDRSEAVQANHETRITRLESAVDLFGDRINAVEQYASATRKQAFQGIAAVAAMNVEVPALAPGEQAFVAGVGSYGGQGALALGYVRSNFAGQVFSLKVGVSGGRAAVSAGAAFKF